MKIRERKEELQYQLKALHSELNTLIDAEDNARDATFVGRCFKFKNSYSSPKNEKDCWWRYIHVHRANTGLYCLCFQVDSDGSIRIEPNLYMTANVVEGYTEIKSVEFEKRWAKCVNTVNKVHGLMLPKRPKELT